MLVVSMLFSSTAWQVSDSLEDKAVRFWECGDWLCPSPLHGDLCKGRIQHENHPHIAGRFWLWGSKALPWLDWDSVDPSGNRNSRSPETRILYGTYPGKTNINLENDGIEDKMIFLLTMAIGRCYVRFQRVLSLLQDMLSAFIAEMCANMHKLNMMKPSPDRVL